VLEYPRYRPPSTKNATKHTVQTKRIDSGATMLSYRWRATNMMQPPVNKKTQSTPGGLYAADDQQENSNQQQQPQPFHQLINKCHWRLAV